MHIHIYTPDGYTLQISSTNPETIGRWIMEQFLEMGTSSWDLYKYPPRFMVYPSYDMETRNADWVTDTRVISQGFEASNPMEFLEKMRQQIEEYGKYHNEAHP